jgi:hypothetical protein
VKDATVVCLPSLSLMVLAAGCSSPGPSPDGVGRVGDFGGAARAAAEGDLATRGTTAEALTIVCPPSICSFHPPPLPQCQTYAANATVNVPTQLQSGNLGTTFSVPFTTCGFLTDFTNMNNQIPNGSGAGAQAGRFILSPLSVPRDPTTCVGNQYFVSGWGNLNGVWTSLGTEEYVGSWNAALASCTLGPAVPGFLDSLDFTLYQTVRLGVTLDTNNGTQWSDGQIQFATYPTPG